MHQAPGSCVCLRAVLWNHPHAVVAKSGLHGLLQLLGCERVQVYHLSNVTLGAKTAQMKASLAVR
jgi:hypothetical protein